MRLTDVDLFGVLISPLVPMMLAAFLVVAAVRRGMLLAGWMPRVWHPALFDLSLYVIVLCVIVLFAGGRLHV
jgi:hypothetical protein